MFATSSINSEETNTRNTQGFGEGGGNTTGKEAAGVRFTLHELGSPYHTGATVLAWYWLCVYPQYNFKGDSAHCIF